MRAPLKDYIRKIQRLSAEQASELLITDFSLDRPNTGEVFLVLPHRSWPKSVQKQLGYYFLQNTPHSYDKGYSALLKIMSLSTFIEILKRNIPKSYDDRKLLEYYVEPLLLDRANNETEQNIVEGFLSLLEK